MSWWDTKSFSGLASQALKSAQKQIDKVLDIDESEKVKPKSSVKTKSPATATSKGSASEDRASKEESSSWDSWSSWITPKSTGSGNLTEAETEASQSGASSSWGFSWGSQGTTTSTPHASSLSSTSKAQLSTTSQASSPAHTVSLSGADRKQNKKHTISETTKSVKVDKSKEDVGGDGLSGLDCSQADDSRPESDLQESVRKEQLAETLSKPAYPKEEEKPTPKTTAVSEDPESPEREIESSERKQSVASDSRGEVTSEPDSSQVSKVLEVDNVTDFPAPVIQAEQHGGEEKECVLAKSDADIVCSLGADVGPSENIDSAGDAPEVCETSVSHTSCSIEETFETIPEERVNKETVQCFDTALSRRDSDSALSGPIADTSDSMISGEGSFAQISSSENLQNTSISSMSSEPTLLSMSTEDNSTSLTQDQAVSEAALFCPPSHSSLISEEDQEKKSSLDALSQEEQSPVISPPLDSTGTVSSNDSSDTSRLDSSVETVVDRSQQLQEESVTEGVDAELEEGSSQHWPGDSSIADLDASTSPSASFVKCMIEDAMSMEDTTKNEDSGSDNHSEEKSESSKVDSEFEKGVYSGHESSDEIETTTSSDIEIISTPTPNGEKNIVDLSPLKFSLQKAARSHGAGHQRSDSQSSSSTNSKGDGEQLSPERDSFQERHDWQGEGKATEQQQDTAAQHEDLDNPQHPQRLLKLCKNQQEKDVVKKLAEMAEVLQARESKLVQLSKDNNDLLETNSILRSQLQQAEEARDSEMTDLNALTEEFTRRMGEAERKIQAIMKEKETVKQQLQASQSQLARRSEDVNLEAVLVEKDEQISGLMEEGEKLSKQQLQNSNIIKKLRSKEKENESLLASQKKKVDQQKEELDRLKVVLDSKEDMEKKQADAIKQLNAAVQMIEKDKAKLKIEVDSSEEKIRGLQATLDNSYKEIAELHKSNASQDSRAQQAALSAEMQVREELKMAMEQENQRYRQEREALIMQIEDLRLSLARMEKDQNRREEMLKQEISDLQMRLQEDESRTQDLTQSVTSATRPLLRQIENLQTTHSIQSSAWEKVERNLTDRLTEAQTVLAVAQEKERTATEKLAEASSRCTALESSNSLLRQEKAQLAAQQDSDRRRMDMLEERKASDVAQLELAKQKLSDEVASLRKDKVFLESQLETARSRLETEKQRVAVAEEQIRILERERPRSRGTPSPVSVSRQESLNSSFSERSSTPTWLPKSEEGEGHFMMTPGPKVSLYDSMRQSGAATLIENLQSQLKLKEGEITQLQADIQQLERTRESMARELVNLTNLNEELQEEVKELPQKRTEYKELDSRYNALLQMYGEKEEKVQELLLDLEDVKEMYKQQINALMK